MQANTSDNPAAELKAVKAALNPTTVCGSGRLLLLALNFLPLIQAGLTASLLWMPYASWPGRVGIALAGLYLLPPLAARLILLLVPIPQGRIAVGSGPFFAWWALFQLQVVFCRLPALEEILRLIPGAYSLWLRLWGARVGRLAYWSPGTLITDRSFLLIGDDVVFGAGVRLNAHVLAKDKDGRMELLLASVKIGDRAVVGGYSLLTAGTEICPDEATRSFLISPPFSVWKDGASNHPTNLNKNSEINQGDQPADSFGGRLRAELALKLVLLVALNVWVYLPYLFLQRHHFFATIQVRPCFFDRMIPFSDQAAWVYLSVYVLLPIGPFLMDKRQQILRYAAGLAAFSFLADVVFLFWPTYCLRPNVAGANGIYRFVISMDNPYDAFPSLHAAFAVYSAACGGIVLRHLRVRRRWRWGLWLWALLILWATLATKQHVLVDIAVGSMLGFGASHCAFNLRSFRSSTALPQAATPNPTLTNPTLL